MAPAVNADASHIWDEAECYVIPRAAVAGGDIDALFEDFDIESDEDLPELCEFVGLLDASAGIPVTPEIEINHFDAFGHPRYRSKASKGTLTTAFTALEDNVVTRKFVLPGSTAGRIGAPKNLRFYVIYVLRDEDIVSQLRYSTRPALLELSNHSGAVEGAQESYEITCHHANDADGDVFGLIERNTALDGEGGDDGDDDSGEGDENP